jgi:site-specific recombinase XerD
MTDAYYLRPQQRNKSRGSKNWHGGIVENGITRWVSLKTESKKVADEWFNKMQAARYSPEKEKGKPASLEAAADAFLADIENTRKRVAGTVALYRRYIEQFKKHCKEKGIEDMREATPSACSEFAQAAFAESSAYTAKNKLTLLRQFFSWAAEHYGMDGKNPFKKIKVAKPKPAPRDFWTVEQCEKIVEAAPNPECKCWFALMAFAGLRKNEARHLKAESVSGGKIRLTGKGGKHAELPMSNRLKRYVGEYVATRGDSPGDLFPALAKQVDPNERTLKKAVEKSGIKFEGLAHYHRFRHSFASNLLRMGRSIKAVQMLMRHEDVSLTLNIYGHLLPSDLEEAAEM